MFQEGRALQSLKKDRKGYRAIGHFRIIGIFAMVPKSPIEIIKLSGFYSVLGIVGGISGDKKTSCPLPTP